MIRHGEFVGEDINKAASIEQLYHEIDNYFNHPTMVKLKSVNHFSMYICKLYCLLSKECRYLIAFVTEDCKTIGTRAPLSSLSWTSFQTRTLADHHDLPSHGYQVSRQNDLITTYLTRSSVTDEATTYACERFPITVSLLHTADNIAEKYPAKGNMVSALETYQTIIVVE